MEKLVYTQGDICHEQPCNKWMQLWNAFKDELEKLPVWAQRILYDDLKTAVQNRITVMHKTAEKTKF